MENLEGETEVLWENLPQRHFVHQKSHLPDPGRRGGKPATNRLSYGVASRLVENVGASTSHNPMGLHGLLQGQLYFYYLFFCIHVFSKCSPIVSLGDTALLKSFSTFLFPFYLKALYQLHEEWNDSVEKAVGPSGHVSWRKLWENKISYSLEN
jgi:hypothetical protein